MPTNPDDCSPTSKVVPFSPMTSSADAWCRARMKLCRERERQGLPPISRVETLRQLLAALTRDEWTEELVLTEISDIK